MSIHFLLLGIFVSLNAVDGDNPQPDESSEKNGLKNSNAGDKKIDPSAKDSSDNLSPKSDSVSKGKGGSIPDKAVVILKKKAPALTDKELNPEFFQKIETRGSGDLPVEVVVPRRYINSSNSKNEEVSEPKDPDSQRRSNGIGNSQDDDLHASSSSKSRIIQRVVTGLHDKCPEKKINGKDFRRAFDGDDKVDVNPREPSGNRLGFSRADGQSEGLPN